MQGLFQQKSPKMKQHPDVRPASIISMMIRPLLRMLSAVLLSLFLFASCSGQQILPGDPFNPLEISPAPVPSGWSAFENYGHPVKVASVAMEKVPARQIHLPENQTEALLKPLSDGGCISVSTVLSDEKDISGNPILILHVIRFKADGSVRWERRYDSERFQGFPVGICVFPDDGFALSLRIATNAADGAYGDQLWRFSPEGDLLRQTTNEQVRAGELDHIFAAKDGAVLAAGTVETWPATNAAGSGGGIGISLLRLDGNSLPQEEDAFGETGSEMLQDASYAAGTGIVLSWTRTHAGENGGSAFQNQYGITCLDENLDMKWQTQMSAGETLYEVQALQEGMGVLCYGTSQVAGTGANSASGSASDPSSMRSAVFCFDENGNRLWTYMPAEEKAWIRMAVRLSEGRFLIGVYHAGPEGEETTSMVEYVAGVGENTSSTGHARTLDTIPGIANQLVATRDGGFTVILRQTLRAIPQPPYVSSIWTDTEAIVAHYDRNMNLMWRRTIDQYKHALRLDFVVPTSDDQLLIG